LSALLLQVFFGVWSERLLMEQMGYNLMYRWFVGLPADGRTWDATTFTKNRERLQQGDIFNRFMNRLLNHESVKPLHGTCLHRAVSDEHFSVDGTDFHDTRRKNDTHQSTTDPDSRLYKKSEGKKSKLCYMGHATMENRSRRGQGLRHARARRGLARK